jgi:probable blue pigment (indigoidine) exporter
MNRTVYAALILITTLLSGLAFPIGRIGLDYTSPFLLMGARFAIAGAVMALFTARRRQPQGFRQWGRLVLIGVCNSAGVMGCAYYSMHWITSGESAILTFVNPLLVIVLSTIFTGARYKGRQWAGVIVGLLGVAVTFGTHFHVQPGTFIGLLGALFFATSSLLIKSWGPGFDNYVMTAYQMIFGALALFLLSALSEHPHLTINGTTVGVLLWLVFMNSIVQFSVWFYLLQNSDPARTSAFLFLAPFFGVIGGWALLGERLHWYVGAGGALICVGIFLVNWQSGARRAAAEGPQRLRECDII